MKKTLAISMVVLAALTLVFPAASFAKEDPPEPTKMKKLSFPTYKEFELDNGLEVVVIEHHEQPLTAIYLGIRAGSVLVPEGKSSLSVLVGDLLNSGTTTRDSEELAKWIESKGGNFGVSTGNDATTINVDILSDYIDTAYEYLADIVLNPTFPDDEFEEERKRLKTALEFQLSDPNAMADRHFNEVVYGNHPYAVQPTPETVDAVTREDLVAFHKRNFVPNNAIMFVVGDVKEKEVKKAVKKHFGDWEPGEPDTAEYPAPPERTARNISLYHRPGSVQTNLYVGHLGVHPKNEDWPAITVTNKVLGGGATGRLFLNLREEKGWTYGAYSRFTKPLDVGYFRATANVRTEVTDSALTEMLTEIERIVEEPVEQQELEDAKSYLIGNFPTTIETPDQIAGQVAQVKLLGLDKKYLENYRKRIAEVEIPDVQTAAQTYIKPDRLAVVAVGDAVAIKEKLDPIAAVALYDIEGNTLSFEELAIEPSDYEFDTSVLEDMTAKYSVVIQESMNLGELSTTIKKVDDSKIEASSSIEGMLVMEEKMELGAGNFEPMAYSFSMQAGPQQMSAEYAFADGKVTGTVNTPKTDGPKDIDVSLVQGTLLSGSLEYVMQTLPLGEQKVFKFPVLESQSGSLQTVTIEVLGEEELLVAAGSFATYKVKLKQSDGDTIYYLRKEAPHFIVKQEVPSQQLTLELQSVEK